MAALARAVRPGRSSPAGKRETAIISGAASGIGRACMMLFAQRGHRVIGLDRDAEACAALRRELPRRVTLRVVDLMDDASLSWEALRVEIGKGEVLSLIQCVGGSEPAAADHRPESVNWPVFERAFALNVKPGVTLVRLCVPYMRAARRGFIVNVGSVAARRPLDMVSITYPTAKAALLGYSRQLAAELAHDGILVNTICPGIIETPRIAARWRKRPALEKRRLLDAIPLGRLGNAKGVAGLAYYLGTSANTYVTGAIVDANGGLFLP